jgi:RecB family exonuclease
LAPATFDPQFDEAEEGSFGHAVLERAVTSFGDAVAPCNEANLPLYLRAVTTALADLAVTRRPAAAGRAYDAFVRRLGRHLERRMREDAARGPRFAPARLEQSFTDDSIVDGAQLVGKADRIDRSPDGRFVLAIDYKRSGASWDDTRLQLPIYAVMAAHALGAEPAGGFYIGLTKASVSGRVRMDAGAYDAPRSAWLIDATEWQAAVDAAVERAATAIAGIRAGQLPPPPAHPACAGWCGHRLVVR